MSGYDPTHQVLRAALDERRFEVLSAIGTPAGLAMFVSREAGQPDLASEVSRATGARLLSSSSTHDVLWLPANPPAAATRPQARRWIRAARVYADDNADDASLMIDGDRATVWVTSGPQRGGEAVVADLGQPLDAEGVVLALGGRPAQFPRAVAIDALEGECWREVWRGEGTGAALSAAITHPRDVAVSMGTALRSVRYLRIRQLAQSPSPWAIAELAVLAAPPGDRLLMDTQRQPVTCHGTDRRR